MVFSKKPPAKKPRRKLRRTSKKLSVKQMIKSEIDKTLTKTREVKRLWGLQSEATQTVTVPSGSLVPTHVFGEGANAYVSSTLNLTRQGLENEERIGNVIQPLRFTYKGYGYINDTTTEGINAQATHVRLVVGFRRQSSPLNTAIGNLIMEGGKTTNFTNTYTDILASFNWKEFRPFYDKTHVISKSTRTTVFQTPGDLKNYFHFNVDYKFPRNSELVTLEDEFGSTTELYNNNNIYAMFIVRQMQDGGVATDGTCTIHATSLFQFHDS